MPTDVKTPESLGEVLTKYGYAVKLNPELPDGPTNLVYTSGELSAPTRAKIGDYISSLNPEPAPGSGPLGSMRKASTPEYPWPTEPITSGDNPVIVGAPGLNISSVDESSFTPTAGTADNWGSIPGADDFINTGKNSVFSRAQIADVSETAHNLYPGRQFPLYDGLTTSGPGFAETPMPASPVVYDNPLQERVSSFLEVNHFNPTPEHTPFISNKDGITGTGGIISHTQGTFGAYANAANSTDDLGGAEGYGQAVTTQMLRQLGTRLLVAGTGHTDEADRKDIHDISTGKIMLPSGPQLQVLRVSLADLRPKKYLKRVGAYGAKGQTMNSKPSLTNTNISKKGDRTDADADSLEWTSIAGKSYGHMNSPFEPFDGGFPIGMIITSVTAMLALMLIGLMIEGICAAISGGNDIMEGQVTHSAMGRHGATFIQEPSAAGHYILPTDSGAVLIQQMFGIPFGRNNFGNSLAQGINSFYGFSEGSIMDFIRGGTINMMFVLQQAENLRRSPGYYVGIVRQVVRDTDQMENAVKQAARDAESAGPVFAAFSGIFNVLEAIVTSTTYRFIMTMVGMGDQVLNAKTMRFAPYSKNPDEMLATGQTRVVKSRVGWLPPPPGHDKGGVSGEMVWAHRSPAGCFILPPSIETAAKFRVGGTFTAAIPGHKISAEEAAAMDTAKGLTKQPAKLVTVAGRIDPSTAAAVEEALEAEYVPFYFRDLRTNEIISFHAFLSSFGENYTPEWQAQSGLGRIDAVQIYGRTTRTFDMSFFIAATSEADHEAMWWSINKLVAMVYPQYSEGRIVKGTLAKGDLQFTVPYSQVPSASPVIRIRLGDMMSSNLSRFGLKRLFGIGNESFVSSYDTSVKANEVAAHSELKAQEALRLRELLDTRYSLHDYEPGDLVQSAVNDDGIPHARVFEVIEIIEPPPPKPAEDAPKGTAPKRVVKLIVVCDVNPPDLSENQLEVKEDSKLFKANPRYSMLNGKVTAKFSHTNLADKPPPAELFGAKVLRDRIDKKALEAADEGYPAVKDSGLYDAVKELNEDFFSDDNFMIKSFQDTAGSGLAGVITSLNFAYAGRPWETKIGQRAPLIVEASLSFTVIHDIVPGLSADGWLNAPTHIVGETMRNMFGKTFRPPGFDEVSTAASQQREDNAGKFLEPGTGVFGIDDAADDSAIG